MLKELIQDIAFDRITLSQALTRTKLISAQVQNETLKLWLKKELEGYSPSDPFLPKYRKIWAEIEFEVHYQIGRVSEFIPIHLKEDAWEKDFIDLVYHHIISEPISIVEENIKSMEGSIAYVHLPVNQVQTLSRIYIKQLNKTGAVVRSGRRKVGRNQFQNVIEQTKQRLLDTLQDLETKFPKLEDNYAKNKENSEAVQNIVTNHIYGGVNPMNIAIGENIQQGDISITLSSEHKENLKKIGVDDDQISDLNQITNKFPQGHTSRKTKVMDWLSKVSASLVSRGLYEETPKLIELVNNIM